MEGYHSSVLLDEVIEALEVKDAWYIDTTLGDGGHSLKIIEKGGKVVGIDVDPQALERVRKRFEQLGISQDKYKLIQGNFRDIKNLIQTPIKSGQTENLIKFAGAIFDLGVSSLQLESPQRGFSFMKAGPLDMRMDPTLSVRALDLINAGGRKELSELFKNLGEEEHSKRLADALVRAREVVPFETTLGLAQAIERALGRKGKIPARHAMRGIAGRHPATKVFQALRIAVNDELEALKEGLEQVKELLDKNGLLIVISFHSLEDRIVKSFFKEWEKGRAGKVLTKKPLTPPDFEINKNPRSRSAKMRVFKKYDNY